MFLNFSVFNANWYYRRGQHTHPLMSCLGWVYGLKLTHLRAKAAARALRLMYQYSAFPFLTVFRLSSPFLPAYSRTADLQALFASPARVEIDEIAGVRKCSLLSVVKHTWAVLRDDHRCLVATYLLFDRLDGPFDIIRVNLSYVLYADGPYELFVINNGSRLPLDRVACPRMLLHPGHSGDSVIEDDGC